MEAISRETALQLCKEIQEANRGRWYTVNGLWCWGCSTFSRGNPEKRCFASRPDSRGCGQVNERFDALPMATVLQPQEAALDPEPVVEEQPFVIYLPPAGFSARQRRMICAGCGRQFRLATSQSDAQYCPTCDYRRMRGQLIQQDSGGDLEDSSSGD